MPLGQRVQQVSDGDLVDAVHVVRVAVPQGDLHRVQERLLEVLSHTQPVMEAVRIGGEVGEGRGGEGGGVEGQRQADK